MLTWSITVLTADLQAREEAPEPASITCVADIYSLEWKLTIPKLHQQLELLRMRGVPDIRPNSNYRNKAEKQKGLEEAFKRFQANPAQYPLPRVFPEIKDGRKRSHYV